MGYLFIEGTMQQESFKVFAKYGIQHMEFISKSSREFLDMQGKVWALLNMFRHEYPFLMSDIQTENCVRFLLSEYREAVQSLSEAGILEQSVGIHLKEKVSHHMHRVQTSTKAVRSYINRIQNQQTHTGLTSPEKVFMSISLCECLTEAEMEKLLEKSTKKELEQGKTLVKADDDAKCIYVVGRGVLATGNIFIVAGESLVYNCIVGKPYGLDVTAYSDDCVIFQIDKEVFMPLVKNDRVEEMLYRMAASQYLRVLLFRENKGIDVGQVLEANSQSRYVKMAKTNTYHADGFTFLLKGRVATPEGAVFGPTILRPSTYEFDKGSIFFILQNEKTGSLFMLGATLTRSNGTSFDTMPSEALISEDQSTVYNQYELNCMHDWQQEGGHVALGIRSPDGFPSLHEPNGSGLKSEFERSVEHKIDQILDKEENSSDSVLAMVIKSDDSDTLTARHQVEMVTSTFDHLTAKAKYGAPLKNWEEMASDDTVQDTKRKSFNPDGYEQNEKADADDIADTPVMDSVLSDMSAQDMLDNHLLTKGTPSLQAVTPSQDERQSLVLPDVLPDPDNN